MLIARSALGSVLFFLFSASIAASFDCTKSVNEVEEAICSNKELSALDESLSIQFKQLVTRTQKPKTLIEEQKAWMKKDRNVCKDLSCLKNAYVSRIASLNDKSKTSSTCSITEQALIGTWKGAESSDFEEMAFLLDGERRSFLSWRHGHQEMIGNWQFRDCVIYIIHPDNAKLSFDYVVKKYVRGTLYLQEIGQEELVLYQRFR